MTQDAMKASVLDFESELRKANEEYAQLLEETKDQLASERVEKHVI